MKKIKKILLIYKETVYKRHFLRRDVWKHSCGPGSGVIRRLKEADRRHMSTLLSVEKELQRRRLNYSKRRRGSKVLRRHFDLVISVGGDGTFMEAASRLTRQMICGVNSDPCRSIGRFCSTDSRGFPGLLDQILSGKATILALERLRVTHKGKTQEALNDVLICHENPAAMSHYLLKVGKTLEEQRSSGLWVSTPAGSSGAIHSAGGRRMGLTSRRFQYRPRELYVPCGRSYQLRGGLYPLSRPLNVVSLMTEGLVCLDGSNVVFPFSFGDKIKITRSSLPLRVLGL